MSTVLIPGSFDPPTLAHMHLISSATRLGRPTVCVAKNMGKQGFLLASTRAELLRRSLLEEGIDGDVIVHEGLLSTYVKENGVSAILRGVRNESDFSHEIALHDVLAPDVPIFWQPGPGNLRSCSSSLVRELLSFGPEGGVSAERFLYPAVSRALQGGVIQLRQRFADMWKRLNAWGDERAVFESLLLYYGEKGRSYHTFGHISAGLRRMGELSSYDNTTQWDVVEWALWFHDIVQDRGKDEEIKSADIAVNIARRAMLPDAFCEAVLRAINATTHKQIATDREGMAIQDIDLSIFTAPEDEFDKYEARIREEWGDVPEPIFREVRSNILSRFLERPSIYSTAYAKEHWTQRAQKNLMRSIHRLRSGEALPTR